MATVCVVGAAGYLGSQLIRTLLHRGFTVNATLRNPDDPQKTRPLMSLEGASQRLKLFKADLSQENSFDSAIHGCTGVFHVASPLTNALLGFSDEEVLEAAEKGVLNVLRSCSRAKTVKRVVYTSSFLAAAPINENGDIVGQLDESRWTPVNFVKNQKQPYSVYKTVAEQTAFRFGEEIGIQVVSIGSAIVAGPFITDTFPFSCLIMLSPLTGAKEINLHLFTFLLQTFIFIWACIEFGGSVLNFGRQQKHIPASNIPEATFQRKNTRSISVVHIDDVCNAHVFLMEQPSASGRHICPAVSTTLTDYFGFLRNRYPHLPLKIEFQPEEDDYPFSEASSKKLTKMGFVFKHGFVDAVDACISAGQQHGFLR